MLTEAAVYGKIDRLIGLKENVIIGKLIPAHYLLLEEVPAALPEEPEALTDLLISEMTEEVPGAIITEELEEPSDQLPQEDDQEISSLITPEEESPSGDEDDELNLAD